jgi:hypothetical protein
MKSCCADVEATQREELKWRASLLGARNAPHARAVDAKNNMYTLE